MALHPIPVLASVAVPLAMLLGGLAILVVGLALLAGDRRRDRGEVAASTLDAAGAGGGPGSGTATAPCDWAAWLATEDGDPVLLRTPMGRPCCVHVLRVRELDALAPTSEDEDVLTWSGDATTIGPTGTRTTLRRTTVRRRWRAAGGGLGLELSVEPGPAAVVASEGWDQPAPREEGAGTTGGAPEAWRRHLDALHATGARPDDGPPRGDGMRARRIEVTLTVVEGCDRAPLATTVDGRCETRSAPGDDDGAVVTDRSRAWLAAGTEPAGSGAGVQQVEVTTSPGATTSDDLHVVVDGAAVRIELGSAIDLGVAVAGGDGPQAEPRRMSASTVTLVGARVQVRGADADRGGTGCTRCVPSLEVVVGTDRTSDARTAHTYSRSEGRIRLDARELTLRRPDPDGTDTCWGLAEDLPALPVARPHHETT